MFSQNDNINILVIRFKRIGDAILSLPLCHSLKLTFPNSKVDFVLYEEASPLFEGHPYIDNVITITKKEQKNPLKYIKKVYNITRKRYDIIIEPKNKNSRGFILEFKVVKEEEDLNKVSKEAIEQIINKKYDTQLKERGIKDITLVGIAFFKKLLKVSYKC